MAAANKYNGENKRRHSATTGAQGACFQKWGAWHLKSTCPCLFWYNKISKSRFFTTFTHFPFVCICPTCALIFARGSLYRLLRDICKQIYLHYDTPCKTPRKAARLLRYLPPYWANSKRQSASKKLWAVCVLRHKWGNDTKSDTNKSEPTKQQTSFAPLLRQQMGNLDDTKKPLFRHKWHYVFAMSHTIRTEPTNDI